MDSQIQDVRKSLVDIKSKIAVLHVLSSQTSHEAKTRLEDGLEAVQALLLSTEKSLKDLTAGRPDERYREELGYMADDLHRQLQNFQSLQRQIRERREKEVAIMEEEANAPKEDEEASPLLSHKTEKQQERRELFGELALNRSIIAERDAGIQEIQRAIYDVNEIFKDLGMLVSEQAGMLTRVEENIEDAASRTRNAAAELHRANETRKRKSWTVFKFIAALLFGIVMIILIRDLIL